MVSQLSGESEVTAVQTREGQYRARLVELQEQLDKLLLQYTDQHPDVIRVRHQISDLQASPANVRLSSRSRHRTSRLSVVRKTCDQAVLYGQQCNRHLREFVRVRRRSLTFVVEFLRGKSATKLHAVR